LELEQDETEKVNSLLDEVVTHTLHFTVTIAKIIVMRHCIESNLLVYQVIRLSFYLLQEAKIKIGKGVYLSESIFEKVRTISDTPEKLARNLFQSLFKKEEIVGRSLCGGNGTLPIPSIDPRKRDAIISQSIYYFIMYDMFGSEQSL